MPNMPKRNLPPLDEVKKLGFDDEALLRSRFGVEYGRLPKVPVLT